MGKEVKIKLADWIYKQLLDQVLSTELQTVTIREQFFNNKKLYQIVVDAGGSYHEAYEIMRLFAKVLDTRDISINFDYGTEDYYIYCHRIEPSTIVELEKMKDEDKNEK